MDEYSKKEESLHKLQDTTTTGYCSLNSESQINESILRNVSLPISSKDNHVTLNEYDELKDNKSNKYSINIPYRVKTFKGHKLVNLRDRHGVLMNTEALKSCGTILFPSDTTGCEKRKAYYTRLESNTDPNMLFTFLTWAWLLPPPNVLLSILGGANTLVLKNNAIKKIKLGLIQATISTGAWLVSGGTQSGVMKLVGEAVVEHTTKTGNSNEIVALGIATWGVIEKRKEIFSEDKREIQPSTARFKNLTRHSRCIPLDSNHTHFLLVDTGSKGSFGDEIELRYTLEKTISGFRCKKYEGNGFTKDTKIATDKKEEVKIPVVKIVIGGGCRTLKEVITSLEHGFHVLIVDGSGRAANFVSRAIDLSDDSDIFGDKMKEYAKKYFGSAKMIDAMIILKDLWKTKYKQMLHVFSIKDTNRTLDSVLQDILFSAFKGVRTVAKEQLTLELDLVKSWKRVDIAEEEIFDLHTKEQLPVDELRTLFQSSLIDDRADFVELILDYVADVNVILPVKYNEYLLNLYENRMKESSGSSAGHFIHNKILAWQQMCGKCSKKLDSANKIPTIDNINDVFKNLLEDRTIYTLKQNDIITDLFLWAVLMNHKDMAMVFWQRGKKYISTALIASCLLKSLSGMAYSEGYMELGDSHRDNSRYFEQLALNVLQKLYLKKRTICQDLLVTKVENYGDTTPLALAELKDLKKFMAHTACQTTLNTIWKGDIPSYTSTWKIFVTFIFPVLAPRFMTNVTKIQPPKKENETEGKQQNRDLTCECECCISFSKAAIDLLQKIMEFYSAPVSKFIGNLAFYIVFLTIFSLMTLTDLNTVSEGGPSVLEYIIWVWTLTMIVEELRQISINRHLFIKDKLYGWISDAWNLFDCFMYLLFITSVVLRFVLSSDDFFYARLVYTVTLGMHILRSMQFLLVSRIIGPKVVMIGRMITDLLFFIILFALFIGTFGVMYQAILFPNSRPSWQLFKDIIYYPYWQVYGELFLDTIEGKEPAECTSDPALYLNGTEARCAHSSPLNFLLLAVYMILTNILLFNILIAMFSYTFQKIHSNSELIWKFHRFRLVHEYYNKPTLAPPLNILNYIFWAIKYCFVKNSGSDRFNKDSTKEDQYIMHLFEKEAVDSCLSVSYGVERYSATLMSTDGSPIEDDEWDSDHDQTETLRQELAYSLRSIHRAQEELRKQYDRDMQSVRDLRQAHEKLLKHFKQLKQHVLLVEVPNSSVNPNRQGFISATPLAPVNTTL